MWPGRRMNSGWPPDEADSVLDLTKGYNECLRNILINICKKQGSPSEIKRLSYLNDLVKLLVKSEHDYNKLGFTAEEILLCLRPTLLHETTQVRSGGLRALRYMLRTKAEASICYKLQYQLLIARSLDLIMDNDNERVQAMRVVRRLMFLDASQFPVGLARALVSIACGTEDRLINVTLGALSELCILNPEVLISVGGVTSILRGLANVKSARMAEALIGSLLYLQNKPATRLKASLNLNYLAAPYTDIQAYEKNKESQGNDRFKWPHATLLSTLRSWPGVLHFCHPLKDGLRSIVATLYLNQLDVRKAILDLLYELLCLAQPEWSDEMSVALEAVDPSRTQEAFKLSEGFVAAEGKAVLPHLSKCRVNLSELHLSLLLYCFLEVGLLDAIVEVIIGEDTFLSVRATILLGELLHLIHLLLPPECCHLTPSLPNLLSYAVRGRPHSASRLAYSDTSDIHSAVSMDDSNSDLNNDPLPKKDNLSNRVPGRSGRSSARSVSESSADKNVNQNILLDASDGITDQNIISPHNSQKKEFTEDIKKSRGDEVGYLLKDVREVLADMTNADDLLFPSKTYDRKKSMSWSKTENISLKSVSGESVTTEPPQCSRAQQRALAAVTALTWLHRLLRQRPAPASIHLDHVLAAVSGRSCLNSIQLARVKGKTQSRSKLYQTLTKECDDAIKDTQVLANKDCYAWNWDIIRAILKSRPECLIKCEENHHKQFLRRLVQFVIPSSTKMSTIRVDSKIDRRKGNTYTLCVMELLDCLVLGPEESEGEKLLVELLTSIKVELDAISSSRSPHDCLFSPQAVLKSLCQDYFLLLGHLTRYRAGCDLLNRLGIIKVLLTLATTSKHDSYVRLIISSLDYSSDERIRNIMSSTLVCEHVPSRLYATKFLHILLRTPLTKQADYAQWVVELLANQLSDEDRPVSLAAIAALDEACDCKEYLEALINLRPSLLHLGDNGLLLLIRFLSTEKGFTYMSDANFVSTQLSKWVKFNYKYVCIVEGALSDGLTLVERDEDGCYSSRLSHNKRAPSDVYVPPHLYGQLARHQPGLNALFSDKNIPKLVQVVLQGVSSSDSDIMELKAALWALGHFSSSPGGALWARANSVTQSIVALACHSPVYSIRSTAFHAIALTATNVEGADTLRSLGWHTVRHNRSQQWPVVTPLSYLEESLLQYQDDKYSFRDRVSSESTYSDQITKNGLFILGEDSSVDIHNSFISFPSKEQSVRERKSATLPPGGSSHMFHHNRSYSESKADSEWARSTTPAPSNSGSDITDIRSTIGQENSRLYSESSTSGTSSCGESYQPRSYISERIGQTLSPIPSSGSLTTVRSRRRASVSSSQGPQLSPKDVAGYAAMRNLHRGRRPTLFVSPHLSLHLSQSAPPVTLSPLSPIDILALPDWKQLSPLMRQKHPDHLTTEPQFEVSGVNCPLPSDCKNHQTLHYESSRSCIAQPPEDSADNDSTGPCFQGICLPQHLIDLFPEDEFVSKNEDPQLDNSSITGMDISSGDSETDTAAEGEVDHSKMCPVFKRRHDKTSCLLCVTNKGSNSRQMRWRKVSASSQNRTRTDTESSYGGGGDCESPIMLPWQSKGGLEGIASCDSSGTDITSVAQRSIDQPFKSRSVVRKEVLKLAEQLCNPVFYKTFKQALLQLKQVYPDVFNDICVYSDVCVIMSTVSFRICARRLLQELFLDATFSEMCDEPLGILNIQNTDAEDGTCAEKISTGTDMVVPEDINFESNSWKSSGPKVNGIDTEQRAVQGCELEVILENDARSECSDMCQGTSDLGVGQAAATVNSTTIAPPQPHHITSSAHKCPSNNSATSTMPTNTDSSSQFQLTVSKSSQQLRKEFFITASELKSSSEKETGGSVSEKETDFSTFEGNVIEKQNNSSVVKKVSDSISNGQGMLDTKKTNVVDSTSNKVKADQAVNNVVANKSKIETVPLISNKIGIEKRSGSCSPQLSKRGQVLNNTKLSNASTKNNYLLKQDQSTTLNTNISTHNKSHSITSMNNSRLSSSSEEMTATMIQSKIPKNNTSSEASTSKVTPKNVKSKTNDISVTSGKPPSGSGRQRKKAVTKIPNKLV